MKLIAIFSLFVAQASLAAVADYEQVSAVSCLEMGTQDAIALDFVAQTATATITWDTGVLELSAEGLKEHVEEDLVRLEKNFFDSGYDVLAGGVISMTQETFGTVAVVIQGPLESLTQEMPVFFMEAMSGKQVNKTMTCTFTLKSN